MKSFSFFLLSFLVFFSPKKIFAQDSPFSFKINMGANGGGAYSDIQAGLFFRDGGGGFIDFPDRLISICAGVETNYLFKQDFRLVPKVSFDYHITEFPFSFGFQSRYYPAKDLDFSKASVQICPHIGTNFLTVGYINFGYNFGLTNRDIIPDLGFQVNLGVNFPLE